MAGPFLCLYVEGRCEHPECGEFAGGYARGPVPPEPTVEEYCAAGGHAYAGDDGPPPDGRGRCYCGQMDYPLGGPPPPPGDGLPPVD